ncbi:MAG: twin-arginine translocation signal domain-containing protein [Candidatus Rokuibacteriota bacterium]
MVTTRREFLKRSLAVPGAIALGAAPVAIAQEGALRPTSACGAPAPPTVAQTEGPYFKPRSPLRTSLLEPGVSGSRIVVSGTVLSTDCRPVPRALLDFWQADDGGGYDNVGFRLRGHQFSGDGGEYRLETVVPGLYPGRTRHIHVKVQAPHQPILTTQLYFPGEQSNASDFIFNPALVVRVDGTGSARVATFDFVLREGRR